MEKDLIEELFVEPKKQFEAHLQTENNTRIIFSGPFGSGKTTFLKKFFEDHNSFEVLRVYPVNYSISRNEDIYEYIKYNLILDILTKPTIEVTDFGLIDILQNISKEEADKFFQFLLPIINVVGIDLGQMFEKLKELKLAIDKRTNEGNEGDVFANFLDSLRDVKGNIYENDLVTRMLVQVLNRSKSKSEKENVLIIDDIDRLDPEHVFRILNIFSAHFDEELYTHVGRLNKLGFDKVILVFDYKNIKSLFHNRYGKGADFSGYIDKFYSTNIFHFDNRTILVDYIKSLILVADHAALPNLRNAINYFGRNKGTLEEMIIEGVLSSYISIRNLKKIRSSIYMIVSVQSSSIRYMRGESYKYDRFLLSLFCFLIGGIDNIETFLQYLKKGDFKFNLNLSLLNLIYNFLNPSDKDISEIQEKNEWTLIIENVPFTFSLDRQYREYTVSLVEIQPSHLRMVIDKKHSYILFEYFLEQLRTRRIFE